MPHRLLKLAVFVVLGAVVNAGVAWSVAIFVVVYLSLALAGTLVIAAFEIDMVTAATASIASLGNVGPGLAGVGPSETYHWLPAPVKLFLAFYMMLGRLELFTVLVLFLPLFWRK